MVYEDEGQQPHASVPHNKLQCQLCLTTFEDEEAFAQDQTTHLVQFSDLEMPQTCPLCRARVDNKWSLNDHMRSVHYAEMKDNGCCAECSMIMPERLLSSHIMKKHPAKMEATYFNSPVAHNDIALEPQVQITAVRSLAPVDKGSSSSSVLNTSSSRECNICQKVFSHGLKLCAHLTGDYVTNTKQLFCTICATKWDTLSQFNVHVASVHLKAKPYMCKDCNFSTSRRAFLASHLESSHKVKGEAANDHIQINQDEMAKVSQHITGSSVLRFRHLSKK